MRNLGGARSPAEGVGSPWARRSMTADNRGLWFRARMSRPLSPTLCSSSRSRSADPSVYLSGDGIPLAVDQRRCSAGLHGQTPSSFGDTFLAAEGTERSSGIETMSEIGLNGGTHSPPQPGLRVPSISQ